MSVNPQDQLPTVSADHCHNIHFHFYEPRAFGSIYTAQCSDVVVHLQPPYPRETTLDTPADGEYQYVSSFQAGKMITELVVRGRSGILALVIAQGVLLTLPLNEFNSLLAEGAGYATTAAKKELAERREKECEFIGLIPSPLLGLIPRFSFPSLHPNLIPRPPSPRPVMRRFEEHIVSMLKISKPGESETKKPTRAPPIKPSEAPPTKAPPKVQAQQDGQKEKVAHDIPSPEVNPDDSPLAAELKAKRRGLKPTEVSEMVGEEITS